MADVVKIQPSAWWFLRITYPKVLGPPTLPFTGDDATIMLVQQLGELRLKRTVQGATWWIASVRQLTTKLVAFELRQRPRREIKNETHGGVPEDVPNPMHRPALAFAFGNMLVMQHQKDMVRTAKTYLRVLKVLLAAAVAVNPQMIGRGVEVLVVGPKHELRAWLQSLESMSSAKFAYRGRNMPPRTEKFRKLRDELAAFTEESDSDGADLHLLGPQAFVHRGDAQEALIEEASTGGLEVVMHGRMVGGAPTTFSTRDPREAATFHVVDYVTEEELVTRLQLEIDRRNH